jgi:hypothetical protein
MFMKKIWGIISILFIFVTGTTFSENVTEDDIMKDIVIPDNGYTIFKNDQYLFVAALVKNLHETTNLWWSIPERQEFPNLPLLTNIEKNESLALFLVYTARSNDINLNYEFWLVKPDGTHSRANRLEIERGLYSNNFNNVLTYRRRISEIESKKIPFNLLYRAASLPTINFDENSLIGKYQFNINIYDKEILITNMILEFNINK